MIGLALFAQHYNHPVYTGEPLSVADFLQRFADAGWQTDGLRWWMPCQAAPQNPMMFAVRDGVPMSMWSGEAFPLTTGCVAHILAQVPLHEERMRSSAFLNLDFSS